MERDEVGGTRKMHEKTKRRRKSVRHHIGGRGIYISTNDQEKDFTEEEEGKTFDTTKKQNGLQKCEVEQLGLDVTATLEMVANVSPIVNKEKQEMVANVIPLISKDGVQHDHKSRIVKRNLTDKITLLESTVQKYRAELASTTTSVTAKNIAIAKLQEKIAELKELLHAKDKKIAQLETQLSLTFEDKQETEKQFYTLLDELQNLDLTGYVDQSSGLDLSDYVNYNGQSSGDLLDKKQSFKKQPSRFSKFFDSIKNDKLPALKRRLSTDNTFARVQSVHCYHRPVAPNGTEKPSELKTNIIEEEIPINFPQHEDLSDDSYKDSKESRRDSVKSQLCIIM